MAAKSQYGLRRLLPVAILAGSAVILSGTLHGESAAPLPEASGEATYVGEETCMGCHRVESEHFLGTRHARIFRGNPRNELEARVCEACHGPGSKHLTDPADRGLILSFTRASEHSTGEMNGACLACHRGGDRIHWPGSVHHRQDLACSDCHNPMARISDTGLLAADKTSETCYTCHQRVRMEFRKRSHMPLPEGKMTCTDCHNPHGSTQSPLLKADTTNQLCYQCHEEKRGPFLFEHAPVRENCLTCHEPHGSSHEKLLITNRTFLCQQCHMNTGVAGGHPNELLTRGHLADGPAPDPRLMNRGCLNCHSRIHGSNHPSGARFHR